MDAGLSLPGRSPRVRCSAIIRGKLAAIAILMVTGLTHGQTESSLSLNMSTGRALTAETSTSPIQSTDAGELLTEQSVVAAVLANNPSVEQMVAAWRAAQARVQQERALDDPMIGASVAPQSFRSNDVGYRIEASQKFYFPGKRHLRGRAAAFEASAAKRDIERIRQELAEEASQAYYDYFLVFRSIAINAESVEIVKQLKANAESRFATGKALQQDVLQADVETGRLEEQRLSLTRLEAVNRARLNTLLNREPNESLATVPDELITPMPLDEPSTLQARALAQRPELQALAQQAEAERARWALACKEYCPDFEIIGAYDTFWRAPDGDLRAMVGVRVNAPIRRGRRNAAVAEAQSRVAEKILAYRRAENDVRFEVTEAYEGVRESDSVVRLYSEKLIQTAEQSVSQAQSAYATNRSDFLTLLTAQRSLIDLRMRYYEAFAESYKRRAALRKAVGDPVGGS
ncbi:TolC family protein [bacterium]|nr:TolC family protein [bacterium]